VTVCVSSECRSQPPARQFPEVSGAEGDEMKAAADPEITFKFGLKLLLDSVEGQLTAVTKS
ncbi:hypothetical protein, partial [Deinococcus soli (ex Cha et al. 2016)]|uniref:hypothetical protein n=1 Tax=Deinococcus soli (ex Cha et al. 2016) TaxID=1309411 RepID=UPI001E301126